MCFQKLFVHAIWIFCNSFFEAIKKRMEKDVDEVQKIARLIKTKIEDLDRDVRLVYLVDFMSLIFLANLDLLLPELFKPAEAWMWKRNSHWAHQDNTDSVSHVSKQCMLFQWMKWFICDFAWPLPLPYNSVSHLKVLSKLNGLHNCMLVILLH